MSIIDLVNQLSLINLTISLSKAKSFSKIFSTDLLEVALKKINNETLWVTGNTDPSILSVAYFKETPAILFTNVEDINTEMINTAIQKEISLLGSRESLFVVCGKLFSLFQYENLS